MIFLLIKGASGDAQFAATERGIPIELHRTNGRETSATTSAEHIEAVRHWFGEDLTWPPPYRPGSLLHYAVREEGRR